ncbi:hypothetical protein B0A48_14609 [Cryoendolithus antarcticus]|uniref:Protoporphyrinogen oxidase n=1 Tax=Cryoendolithus antarcticus TaxID=1507870 RepID=A0A1V8SL79_9PEZI|nr:hypothetical protein B0A48_14609 [Cryoendolithus antarcticus]
MLRRTNALTTASPLRFRGASTPSIQCLIPSTRSRGLASEVAANNSPRYAVLGSGITGLATAYFITQQIPRAKVTVFEAKDRIGGWLASKRVEVKDGTILFEGGPRTLRPAQNGVLAARLIQELDLGKDAIFTQNTSPAAINRYLYYPDRLVRMPHPSFGVWENFHTLMSEPVFATAIWSGVKEFFKEPRSAKITDESIASFFSRRLSREMVDRILSGVIHGIYAGDVEQLSAKSLFPKLYRDEVTQTSIIKGMLMSATEGLEMPKREGDFLAEMKAFAWDPLLKATLKDTSVFTFRDGMGMLSDALARKLWASENVEFKTSTPVKSLAPTENKTGVDITTFTNAEPQQFDHVVSCLSPDHLNALAPATTTIAPETPSVTVMTVNLYFRESDLHPPGFGYLIPRATPFEQNPERALGVVFDTAYAPSYMDTDSATWHTADMEVLKAQREAGRMINVNDFGWYNFPEKPVVQDTVPNRGTKLTVMLGGHWWNDWPAYPDEKEGVAMARSILKRHLNITQEPEAYQVNLQKDCIPQYTVGHDARLMKAHNELWKSYQGRLRVAGSWIQGVGVNDCLRSAYDVVKGLRDGRDGTGLEQIGRDEYVRLRPVRRVQETESA